MAHSYKNIVITPFTANTNNDPRIVFSGGDANSNTDIVLRVYPTTNGTLSFEGTAGQLFSITNDLTNSVFSVNDVSGIPLIDVNVTSQQITLGQFYGNVGIGTSNAVYKLDVTGSANISSPTLLVAGQNVIASFASGNTYAQAVGTSGNAYTVVVGASGNAYANVVGTAGNTYATTVGTAANNYAGAMANSGNSWTQTIVDANLVTSRAYTNTSTTAANNYAGAMANAGNSWTQTIVDANLVTARAYTNTSTTASNTYAQAVGTAGNAYAVAVGTAANNYAGVMANSANAVASATYASQSSLSTGLTSANNYAGAMANSANARADTKVSSVSGTSGRITSSGGTTPAIDLASGVISPTSATGGISAVTVDTYGRVTAVTGSAGYVTSSGVTSVATGTGLTGGTITSTGTLSVDFATVATATNTTAAFAAANGVISNTTAAFAAANQAGVIANAAFAAGNAEFTFSNTVYAAVNSVFGVSNAAFISANSVTINTTSAFAAANQAGVIANAAFAFANGVATNTTAAFASSNSKVASVSGTSGRITSSGGTTPAIDLATAGAGAASYSSGISAVTVDAYGRVTAVTGSAGYVTSSGVTSVASGTGLTGGPITSTGTLSVDFATVATSTNTTAAFAAANGANVFANTTYVRKAGDTITGDLTVQGNLTTSGVVTYANTQTLLIGDALITLNNDIPIAVAPSEDAGIEVKRGSSANVALLWNEGSDRWTFTNDGTNYRLIASNTDVESANNYAGAMANAANVYATTINDANLVVARAYTNTSTTAANTYAQAVGTADNAYAQTVGTSANNYAGAMANAANARADTKVSSVTGTSGRITSSGGTTPAIDLASGVVTPTAATGGISALTVDTYGRVTAITGSAGYVTSSGVTSVASGTGLTGGPITSTGTLSVDFATVATATNTTAAFAAANGKVASVSGTSGRITSSGGTTPAIDLATAGAGAATYSSGISAVTVDAYGRVTSVTGSAGYVTSSGVTSVATGVGLTGGTITSTGTVSLATYSTGTNAAVSGGISSITIDEYGRVRAVTGSAGYVTSSGVTSVSGTGTVSGLTLSGTVTSTGSLTLGGTLSASVIDNMTDEHRLFNNMGDNHGTRTAFDASAPSYNFGWRYVQGNTNGPNINSATQYYSEYVGLGNDYPATGAGSYGMHIAYPRNVTTPYIAIRYVENNALGAWQKISAGYADAAPWSGITGKPTTVSGFGITDALTGASTVNIGTTNFALNRASAAQTLTGVNIDGSAGSATTATTATNWGAYGAVPAAGSSGGTPSTIPRSDVNGYTYFGYINSSTSNSENPAVSQVIVTNGSDNFYRKSAIANFTTYLTGTASNLTAGNATNATNATNAAFLRQTDGTGLMTPAQSITTSGARGTSLNPSTYNYGIFSEFKNSSLYSSTGNYSGLITYAPWVGTAASTGDPSYQLLFSPSGANLTENPVLKIRAGIDSTWGSWNTIFHSNNFTVSSNSTARIWANTVITANTETIFLDLATSGVTAAAYSSGISAITVDAYGRVTSVTGSAGYVTSSGVTSVATGVGLTGGTITSTGTVSLATYSTGTNAAITGGISSITIDEYGRVRAVSGSAGYVTSSGVTSITAGTGLSGGTITSTGTISLPSTGVAAATYSSGISSITVDAQGRITAISGSANYATTSQLSSYAALSGATFTGVIVGRTDTAANTSVANDTGSMSIRGSTTAPATVSFHRASAYAINMGLDTDNIFRIGGWSDGVNTYRLQLAAPGGTHTFNGTVSDSHGSLRRAPVDSKSAQYTLVATDTGKTISITTGGIIVPANVMSAGDIVTIFNNSGSSQTITTTGVTAYFAGTATTGNRTVLQRGVANILCVASNVFVISGSGVT